LADSVTLDDASPSGSAQALAPVSSAARPLRAQLEALVLDSLTSENSRRSYARSLTDFFDWYEAEPRGVFSRALVQNYRVYLQRQGLAPSTINLRLATLRKLAREAGHNQLLDPVAVMGITQVGGVRQSGVRAGNWLTREQARELLAAPDRATLAGLRDRAILAMLLGCALRRAELVSLTVDSLAQREGRWVLPDLLGKGSRIRTVPVPAWVKVTVDEWLAAAAIRSGPLFRSTRPADQDRVAPLTEKMIWHIAQKYARQIGIPKLAPHDLRRTCAKLCRASGGDLEQIQFLLGHASIQTTERYLGTKQNLREAVNDKLGLG
jgi:integrase